MAEAAGKDKAGKDNEKRQFKLSELAQAAGVAGKTIHYYIRVGVLPPARKVRQKLALYDENHLGLLRLVRRLQEEKRLPLEAIARLFQGENYDAGRLELDLVAGMVESAEEGRGLFPSPGEPPQPPARIDIPKAFRAELVRQGILPEKEGPLSGAERELAGIALAAREKGVPLELLAELEGPLARIVATETRAMLRAVDGQATFGQVVRQAGELDRLINRYLETAKTRALRHHFQKSHEESPLAVRRLLGQIYIPSQAFLEKHRIAHQLEILENRIAREPKNARLRLSLSEGLLAIGRYEEAALAARKVLALKKDDPYALAAQAAADVFLGRTDEAIEAIGLAHALRPRSARITGYAAMANLLQAARVGGLISPAQWLAKSMALFQKALTLPTKRLKDRIEILLLKGRAYTILPQVLEEVGEGIGALEELLAIVAQHNERQLGLPFVGFNEIYRVNTHFYLGEAWQLKGDEKRAQAAWEQVLICDPESNFGRRVYRELKATG